MTVQISPSETDPTAPHRDADPAPRWAGPVSGLLSAALAVCVGLLVAAILDVDSPLNAVGSEFIDHTPKWLKIFAVDTFGTNDKLALRTGMIATISVLALGVGALARRRPLLGVGAMAAFGLIGAYVAVNRPDGSARSAIPALVGAVIGGALIWWLERAVAAGDPARETPSPSKAPAGWDRRRFMVTTMTATGAAVVAAGVARRLEDRRIERIRDAAPDVLPTVTENTSDSGAAMSAAPDIPADATLSDVTPFITPNGDFYLIDTALSVPRIRLDKWKMTIGGMVDTPLSLSYDDLLARPQVQRVITIACVSNEVGGNLIGTAVWQGVLLSDLLEEAGVSPDAQQVFGTSVDGWTCGFPVEATRDGRDALIAIGMNGKPLPLQHGFPARVIVPGLYGYVSATKWLSSLDLTRWDDAVGYWVPRGWSRDAPIKTESRIDVPRRDDAVQVGPTPIAGIAWAQHRGIAKVEVRIDDGPWAEAKLGTDVTVDAWRQWLYEWDATAGEHTIQVRATDNTGETQTEEVARPDPDGATGWHTRTVRVTA
ncbi:MAG: hypothetical protein RLZZ623_2932 [Actinomycetota bacterium]